ncbi:MULTISPECIES: glycosyltransferase [unclassified Kitasatospora]|uniref:glycosyltransferase n=1 Tax=unclassified Kitasatospora TaxID=2633591 RepID=UPI00070F0A41|nr:MULTISPECIES: glycosyltransferase [unclassified Kitasatospora]KQV14583.1 glycosyl transferase [Kitasatospora sp. Root107]KRB68123.1 glycosyl transferase [Kitasatospora sp. Root187]
MRVVLSTYGARGSVEPMVGLAVRLRELGAEVRVCAPPDEEFAELLAGVGVELVPTGRPVRPVVTSVVPGSAVGLAQRASELMAAQFETVGAVAEGCDALVATGPLPVTGGARSVAEKLGIRFVHASHQPVSLPSPYQPPPARRGRPLPPGVADNRALWDLDARNANEMFGEMLNTYRAAAGLAPVDNVRDYAFTDRPWLATDPVLSPWRPTELGVVQTGAWSRLDERPLPPELVAFLEAGTAPVYVGFGSTPVSDPKQLARVAVEAVRAQGRRVVVARGWAELELIDDQDDCIAVGEVNQSALFARVAAVVHHGSAGTTTTAARAGAPQVVVAQGADQPYWAERVGDLGIGLAHDGPVPTAESLAVALGTALTSGTRARARAVAGTIRTDGTTVAARLLLDAAG